MKEERSLSGIRPSGTIHLGNYFGAIVQFLALIESGRRCFFFVADLHALTSVRRKAPVFDYGRQLVKMYIACGIDPTRATLYRQSDILEITQAASLLSNIVPVSRLRSCTTFKDILSKRQNDPIGPSAGLLLYPVLMAVDILLVKASSVPVGLDQVQHVEMARDFARRFNTLFEDEVFVIPELNITHPIKVPGLDGNEKMGKSLHNTISLLDNAETVEKKVASIPTQLEVGGVMTAGTRTLFRLTELCCSKQTYDQFVHEYQIGRGKFFGEMKRQLASDINNLFAPIQRKFETIEDSYIDELLVDGAKEVRPIARSVLLHMKEVIGLI